MTKKGERNITKRGRTLRADWKVTLYHGKWVPTTDPNGEGEWMDIHTARKICEKRNS